MGLCSPVSDSWEKAMPLGLIKRIVFPSGSQCYGNGGSSDSDSSLWRLRHPVASGKDVLGRLQTAERDQCLDVTPPHLLFRFAGLLRVPVFPLTRSCGKDRARSGARSWRSAFSLDLPDPLARDIEFLTDLTRPPRSGGVLKMARTPVSA